MKQLDWYIAKNVLAGILLVLLVLLSLFLFFTFIEELDDIGTGTYGAWQALLFVLLQAPRLLYEIFPIAALLGTLLGLGGLANTNELTVMRASGMSIAQILLSTVKACLPVIILMAGLGEWLAPQTEQQAVNLQTLAKSEQVALSTRHGFWVREGNAFINIREIEAGGRTGNIRVYEFDGQRHLLRMTHAEKAIYQNDNWLLENLQVTHFYKNQTQTEFLPRLIWRSLLSPDLLNIFLLKPERLSSFELYKYVNYLKKNEQRAISYELAMWQKVFYPIVIAAMIYMAAPFVFGSQRHVSVGRRVMIGAMVGVIFFLLNRAVGFASVLYGVNPLLSALFPSLLMFISAYFLMRKVH